MKKDIYTMGGLLALLLAIFGAVFYFYQKTKNEAQEIRQSEERQTVDLSALIRPWSPTLGPSMARVVVVEFLDPECESCAAMHPIVKGILKDYEGRLQYVMRIMPLHDNSQLAATWLEAAREQNKLWEALDALFLRQMEWGAHHAPKPELIPQILRSVGVDIAKATVAKEKPEYRERIQKDKEDGYRLGVSGTPTFFVNGEMLLELGDAPLRAKIEAALKATP